MILGDNTGQREATDIDPLVPIPTPHLHPHCIRTPDPYMALSRVTDHLGGPWRQFSPEGEAFLISASVFAQSQGECTAEQCVGRLSRV